MESNLSNIERQNDLDFNELGDAKVAHSVATGELFLSSEEGERKVLDRVETIENQSIKNDAYFRLAQLYYRKSNLAEALGITSKISDLSEQARSLVHLAVAVLINEGNVDLADSIVAKAERDDEMYSRFYQREREKYLEN